MAQAPFVKLLLPLVALAGCYQPPAPLVHGPTVIKGAPGAAAPQSMPIVSVSCEDAAARAVEIHPASRAARAQVLLDAAYGEIAGGWKNPELRAQTGVPDPDDTTRVGVRFRLPIPGQLGALTAAAEAEVEESEAEARIVDAELAAAARLLHVDAREREALAAWHDGATRLAQADRDLVARRTQAGIATGVALESAELALVSVQDDQRLAQGEAKVAAAALAQWAGVSAGAGACAPPVAAGDAHPVITAAEARRAGAHGQAEADARDNWLWPTFAEIAWDQRANNPDRVLFEVGVALPIFDGDDAPDPSVVMNLEDARVAEAQAEVTRAQSAARQALFAAEARLAALPQGVDMDLEGAPITGDQLSLWSRRHALAKRRIAAEFAVERGRVEVRRAAGLR